MASTKKASIVLSKIAGGNLQPDTGYTDVQIKDNSGALIATAVESVPGTSGFYTATWTATPKMGWWYKSGTKRDDWSNGMPIWLGENGKLHAVFVVKKVKVYDSGASPTGRKGDPITFVTLTAPFDVDADGSALPSFTSTNYQVLIGSQYQERKTFISNSPSISGGNITFQTEVSDDGENSSDGKCYSDFIIISGD